MTELARLVRLVAGTVENTWDSIEAALGPLCADDEGAIEVVSAFYDVRWVPVDSAWVTYFDDIEQDGCFSCSWRNAAGMVADIRGRGESYLDLIWDAQSGQVSPRVAAVMFSLGLRPVT